ncbi:hypothetical protein JCM10908_000919 [Rhodotorula pacifica]|uniref:uncharacterized protein n=1 Tax=Rhodotorula pacifica TaxID=1495444 RepID=UPI00317FA59D
MDWGTPQRILRTISSFLPWSKPRSERPLPINLDSLPPELLLRIIEAVSPGYFPRQLVLTALVQVDRKLARLLRSEARKAVLKSACQPIVNPRAMPDELRAAAISLLSNRLDPRIHLVHVRRCLDFDYYRVGRLQPWTQALVQHLGQHFPQVRAMRLCPVRVRDDRNEWYALPDVANLPPTLQYLCVECTPHEEVAPILPECYFKDDKIPTLFHIYYTFHHKYPPYTANKHPMRYVQLDGSLGLAFNSALSNFLLSLPSLRCVFIPQHWSEFTGTKREKIKFFVRDLSYKGVDVREHAQGRLTAPVIPEFMQYLRDKIPADYAYSW